MRLRDLERHLEAHERSTAVPRHREIDFRLARKICADLPIPPPTGSR